MSGYCHINGMINCEAELSQDVTELFVDVPTENEFWHRNDGEDYLFSLSVKESRCPMVKKAFEKLAQIQTKDSVLDEWYFVDGGGDFTSRRWQ